MENEFENGQKFLSKTDSVKIVSVKGVGKKADYTILQQK